MTAHLAPLLAATLDRTPPGVIAVSGGVDSLTLATFASRLTGHGDLIIVHAMSAAVPPAATARVRILAAAEKWRLELLDAGEFKDESYLQNPVNRCLFCKRNLYGTIRARFSGLGIAVGTNTDDLADWRPGLTAANEHDVTHPFVSAGLDKAAVRALAASLGLGGIADLPAGPCLASRIETGIRVDARTLRLVDAIETAVRDSLGAETVRCRIRRHQVVIELDDQSLARLTEQGGPSPTLNRVLKTATALGPVSFEPYRRGSAFVGVR